MISLVGDRARPLAFTCLLLSLAGCGGDPTRVKRVAVRFSKPVFPGQEITTRFWEEGASGDSKTYGFETYNPEDAAVIKNGVVEIA